jgi:hypothetical protein
VPNVADFSILSGMLFAQIAISFHAASMNKNDFIFGKRLLFVYFCTN